MTGDHISATAVVDAALDASKASAGADFVLQALVAHDCVFALRSDNVSMATRAESSQLPPKVSK